MLKIPTTLISVYPELLDRESSADEGEQDWALQLRSLLGPIPKTPPRPAVDLKSLIPARWLEVLPADLDKQPFWRSLCIVLKMEYDRTPCVPRLDRIFRPLEEVDPDDVRVVVLDDAPSEICADGLAYSCSDAPPIPGCSFGGSKTLQNIVATVKASVELCNRMDWISDETLCSQEDPRSLQHWSAQGVLLWNIVSTARVQRRGNSYCTVNRESHWNLAGGAWQNFTHVLIHSLAQYRAKKPETGRFAFLLFGNRAKALVHNKANPDAKINPEYVTSNPNPRSARDGFVGTDCFLLCNKWLETEQNREPIRW